MRKNSVTQKLWLAYKRFLNFILNQPTYLIFHQNMSLT